MLSTHTMRLRLAAAYGACTDHTQRRAIRKENRRAKTTRAAPTCQLVRAVMLGVTPKPCATVPRHIARMQGMPMHNKHRRRRMAGGMRYGCMTNRLLRPGPPAATPRTPIRSSGYAGCSTSLTTCRHRQGSRVVRKKRAYRGWSDATRRRWQASSPSPQAW